jgi:hypothetical protein
MSKALMELLRELKQCLGLKISSIKARGAPDLETFFSGFSSTPPYPRLIQKFLPGGLTDTYGTVLYLLLGSSLSTFYEY